MLFDQIKAIYFDGKIVACRGCSELPLIVSNHVFSKMKARQKLLRESKVRYREMQKEEWEKERVRHAKNINESVPSYCFD